MNTILSCSNICWQKGDKRILAGASLDIQAGQTLALIGPNGAGKSSLLQVMSFLLKPDSGTIRFRGSLVVSSKDQLLARRRMAVVFQQPLLVNATVEYNLALGLKYRSTKGTEIKRKVEEWSGILGINHLRKQNARTLSGGEAQRVNLARALITEPEILFMDEPFTALDTPGKAILMEDLRKIIRQKRLSVVFVTHDYNEVPFLADHVAVMLQGKVVQTGGIKEVFDRPRRTEIAALLGYENLLTGIIQEIDSGDLVVNLGKSLLKVAGRGAVGQKVNVCLRGREVHLAKDKSEFKEPDNIFRGRVLRILPYGEHLKVEVDCGLKLVASLPQSKLFYINLQTGDLVYLRIPPRAPHIILG